MFMNEKITKNMILHGLKIGVIQIISNTNDGCISAQIGDFWFNFILNEESELSVKDFLESHDQNTITNMIYEAINDEPINGETVDEATEWLYYRAVLKEAGCKDL
jgi:hypothetical protein